MEKGREIARFCGISAFVGRKELCLDKRCYARSYGTRRNQAKDWIHAIEMLKEANQQGWPVGELVSHKFSLDDINEAMETNIRMDGFKIAIVNK